MRQGRELELLVAKLEHVLGAGTIAVKSPEFIANRHNGRRIEVDVTLRTRIGSTDVLIALECRDRNGRQGIGWIRELATKRDDIGAAAIVAVSRDGFTADAVDEASTRGVVLKQLSQLSPEEIARTVITVPVEIRRAKYLLTGISSLIYHGVYLTPFAGDYQLTSEHLATLVQSWEELRLLDEREQKPASFEDLLKSADWGPAYVGLGDNAPVDVSVVIPCTYLDDRATEQPRYRLWLQEDFGVDLVGMTVTARVWYQPEPAILSSVFEYSDDDGTIARYAEIDMAAHGKPGEVIQVFFSSEGTAPAL